MATDGEIDFRIYTREQLNSVDINDAVFSSRGGVPVDQYQNDRPHYKAPLYVEFTRLIKPVLQDDSLRGCRYTRTLQPSEHRR